MKAILAIDPGLSGGIAWLYPNATVEACPMPDTEGDIKDIIRSIISNCGCNNICAFIEEVPVGMPGKGAACSKLNANAAFIRGIIMAYDVRLEKVRPKLWQEFFHLGTRSICKSDSQWKNKLKAEAQRRFPYMDGITLKTADAILLLEWALYRENYR